MCNLNMSGKTSVSYQVFYFAISDFSTYIPKQWQEIVKRGFDINMSGLMSSSSVFFANLEPIKGVYFANWEFQSKSLLKSIKAY